MKFTEKLWLFGTMAAGVGVFLFPSIIANTSKPGNIWFWRSLTGFVNLGLLWFIVSRIDLIIWSYLSALSTDGSLSTEAVEDKRQKAVLQTLIITGVIIASWWLVAIAF